MRTTKCLWNLFYSFKIFYIIIWWFFVLVPRFYQWNISQGLKEVLTLNKENYRSWPKHFYRTTACTWKRWNLVYVAFRYFVGGNCGSIQQENVNSYICMIGDVLKNVDVDQHGILVHSSSKALKFWKIRDSMGFHCLFPENRNSFVCLNIICMV